VLQSLEISESTFQRWQNQYGGMKATTSVFPKDGRAAWLTSPIKHNATSDQFATPNFLDL